MNQRKIPRLPGFYSHGNGYCPAENVGRLKLVVPKADTTVRAWLSHESGYLQSFTFAPYRGTSDTTVIDLGNQLPGKYTFRVF